MEAQMKRGFLEACVLAAVSGEESYGYQIVKDVPASMGLIRCSGAWRRRAASPRAPPNTTGGCGGTTASRTPGASVSPSSSPNGHPCRRSTVTWRGRTMTRDEFLNRLGELLACLPADQVKETQEFYAEAIADRMEDGMTEAEAVAAMGTPGEVAEATLDELPAVPRAIARTKRKSTALLWALAIVGSPVWIPLLLAFVAVAAAVYICIWVLALCVWIVAAAFGGAGLVGLLFAVDGIIIGHVPYVLASMGMGFASIGVALLTGTGAWTASKQIARLSALWAKKAVSPFWKDRGNKSRMGAEAAPLTA